MDMKGLSLKNIAPSLLSVGQEVSRIIQDYYPGYTKRIIVIRAPTVFQLAYNALKPFIDSSMKEKMTIASEFDCDISSLFVFFDETPLGTASIAQVHRAVLRATGVEVVIKVLAPSCTIIFRKTLEGIQYAVSHVVVVLVPIRKLF